MSERVLVFRRLTQNNLAQASAVISLVVLYTIAPVDTVQIRLLSCIFYRIF